MTDKHLSYVFAGLAVFFWSTIATAFKLALREMSPAQLLMVASITSLFVLTLISIIEGSIGKLKKVSSKEVLRSAMLGALNPFIYYLILLEAYQRLPAQVAQPLNMIWPIVLVFLSVPLLKKKVKARSFIALFISFIGVYIISSQGQPFSPGKSDTLGIILAAGSSIFWALYFIINLKDGRTESLKLLMNFFFATIYILIFTLARGELQSLSFKGLASGIYVGCFEMGITFFLWLKALKMTKSPDKIANLVFLAPFLSLLFITLILREQIHYTTLIGLVIIVVSLVYQNAGKSSKFGVRSSE